MRQDSAPEFRNRKILGTRIDSVDYQEATRNIITWATEGSSCYICAANVHMVMEAFDDRNYQSIVNGAAMVTPDGMPLVWGLRQLGIKQAVRVYGPSLMLHVCEAAADVGIPIALYGGTGESLAAFTAFLNYRFPGVCIACQIAPPFRPLSADEDAAYIRELVSSGAKIIFVGIGCPKQERWIAEHMSKIPAVMLGVGAAFDFHSGRVKQAPTLMQQMGLEWLYRLCVEPRRLWKRYLKHNPRFIFYFGMQLLKIRLGLQPFNK